CTVRTRHERGRTSLRKVSISRIDGLCDPVRRSQGGRGQLLLFPDLDEEDVSAHQNLRRGLKAESMRCGIPTQLVWPRTLQLTESGGGVQDIATRAWNFVTALYHKAGGSPWRLAEVDPGVCYVGISFYREILEANPLLRTSMAQAFTAAGDG